MLSFFLLIEFLTTTVSCEFIQVTVLTIYIPLWKIVPCDEQTREIPAYIFEDPCIHQKYKTLENALASQSVFQLGLLLALPVVMELWRFAVADSAFRQAQAHFYKPYIKSF
jgi:callose synthase